MRDIFHRVVIALLLSIGMAIPSAAETATTPEHEASAIPTSQKMALVDIAGKQRMLSQRIAKDYLYIGKKIAVSKASRQLNASLQEFESNLQRLNTAIPDPEIRNLLAFVKLSIDEFKALLNKPFTLDNAQLALDLSESLLEGSQFVVDALKKGSARQASVIVAKSGKQRMLSQRIAKYYIAYQAGIKDKNSVDQMKAAVAEFAKNHADLMANPQNSPEINRELKEIDRLWNIVYKFYLGIEKGGLPFIVFTTTDDIMTRMDRVTKQYVEIYKR